MTNDFLFAMMSTKSNPTWRRSTWNGVDYMVCTVAEPQKKLPVFKVGKWSIMGDRRISLYGHDARTMKNFTSSVILWTELGSGRCGFLFNAIPFTSDP